MGICEGRVVIVTGAARGIGREHALEFARQGAKVVINDLGVENDGSGGGDGAAAGVAEEIRALGSEAVLNGDDVANWEGAGRIVKTGGKELALELEQRGYEGIGARQAAEPLAVAP